MPKHQVLDPKKRYEIAPGKCALGIMTKAPRSGQVKTRLVPPLTPNEAAEINGCFLRDLAISIGQACDQAEAVGVAVFAPLNAEYDYENILPADFVLIPQRGESFGERLILAAEDLFQAGFDSVCLINSDSPTVPGSSFAEAVSELKKPGDRVALGPSEDGGYYLIGLKQLHRRMFEQIDWSTERVFEQTRQRAAELSLEVCEIPTGFDVDDRASLVHLCRELLDPNIPGEVAPNTREFLAKIIEREGRKRICPEM